MPEIVERHTGHFIHRDTRLPSQHPAVVKCVDVTDRFPRFKDRQVLFKYGYDGSKRLCVEAALYKPNPNSPWLNECFDVQDLYEGKWPAALVRLTETLGGSTDDLILEIFEHAPWKNVREMDNLEDFANEFGEEAFEDLLADLFVGGKRIRN